MRRLRDRARDRLHVAAALPVVGDRGAGGVEPGAAIASQPDGQADRGGGVFTLSLTPDSLSHHIGCDTSSAYGTSCMYTARGTTVCQCPSLPSAATG